MIKCFKTNKNSSEEIKKIIESNLLLGKEIKKVINFLSHLSTEEKINIIDTIKYYYNLVSMEETNITH